MSIQPAVAMTDVSRRYGSVLAVDQVSLQVYPGQLLALLGPNGAGKSSVVGLVEGFAPPDSGHLNVLGLDPWRYPDQVRSRMGVMLQSGGAHASSRAGQMLALVAACSAKPHDPRWLLQVLGLREVARTPVRHLSGGQFQRLSLAMALVGRPEVLILDEPTAGLDIQGRHLVWDLLRALTADGVAVLLTTHLLEEAEGLADQIAILSGGRLVAAGTPAELTGSSEHITFTGPAELDTVQLARELPQLTFTSQGTRYTVHGPVTAESVAALVATLARHNVIAQDLRTGQRLEQIYLDLVTP